MDRGAWQAVVQGIAKSQTQLYTDIIFYIALISFWVFAWKPVALPNQSTDSVCNPSMNPQSLEFPKHFGYAYITALIMYCLTF